MLQPLFITILIPSHLFFCRKKSSKYFSVNNSDERDDGADADGCWNLKSREEFAKSLTDEELERYGGKAKLEEPPSNRYFKYTHLNEIVMHHGNCKTAEEKENMILFVHFLKGLLDPDPCERWTAYQASAHPFLTGKAGRRLKKPEGGLKSEHDVIWSPPWDPSICRRKLSFKQGALSRPRRLRKPTPGIQAEPPDNRLTQLSSPTYV
jgi:serine/threonine protein kinase